MGFPSLGNPVVLMTVKNATNTWYSSDFSHNDFSVWIEVSDVIVDIVIVYKMMNICTTSMFSPMNRI